MKRLWSSLLVVLFLVGVSSAVHAQGGRHSDDIGMPIIRVMRFVRALELSPEQKRSIALILSSKREAMRARVDATLAARSALNEAVHQGTANRDAIIAASKRVAEAEEANALGRAELFEEITAVLTPEQKAKVEVARERLRHAMADRIGNFRWFIDSWIDEQLEG